jgi:hypothetical protein
MQEPEAPYNNATSREGQRISPPAGAGGLPVAGLNIAGYRTGQCSTNSDIHFNFIFP